MTQRTKQDKASVVVVDDEPLILEAWQEALAGQYEVKLFSDAVAAQQFLETHDCDVALLDIRMPGLDGLTLLQRLKQVQPATEVIIITGHGTIQTAVQAIQLGAYDFICKPVDDLDAAVRRLEGAVERKRLRELNANLRSRLDALGPDTQLIGDSRAMRRVRELISQIADSTAPALIGGDSGTGKELAARALHSQGSRRDKPFIAVNCAAMSDTLLDSELFGHERGAFTGAVSSHKGLFEAADGGVLFLDEIGDVPPQIQVRLLRAIQEGEVRPVGATKSRRVDVRVIAATNVNLERAMRAGQFRDDLYYRISTFRVDLPPLRDRREDIADIAQHLLMKFAARMNIEVPRFSDEALAVLMRYDWPGNVRELNNALEHAATLCGGGAIEPAHLPSFVAAQGHVREQPTARLGTVSSVAYSTARIQLLEEFERRYLLDLLSSAAGNLSEAARRSGIDRSNLRRMLRRHSIQANAFKAQLEPSAARVAL